MTTTRRLAHPAFERLVAGDRVQLAATFDRDQPGSCRQQLEQPRAHGLRAGERQAPIAGLAATVVRVADDAHPGVRDAPGP